MRGRESVFLSLETSYTESALVPGFWGSERQGIRASADVGQMEGFEDAAAVCTPVLTL